MKKLTTILVLLLLCGLFCGGNSYAYDSSCSACSDANAITKPEQKSPYRYPSSGDTYFTYYSNITGYKNNGLWGFYSQYDRSVNIPPMYTEIEGLDSNYIKVKRDGRWGIVSTDGYQLLQPLYDEIETFRLGYTDNFKVRANGYYGIVNASGTEIIPVTYSSITRLSDSYLKVSQANKYGIISANDASIVVSMSYDDVGLLDRYFKVKFGGKWGLLDKLQNTIVPARYDDIKILNNLYFAVKSGRVWGTVDAKTGEEVITPQYDKIEFGKANYLKVKHNGKWGAVNYEGKVVIPIVKGPLEINKELKKIY